MTNTVNFHFNFADHSNPYIALTPAKAFELLTAFIYEQTGDRDFNLYNRAFTPSNYREKKFAARTIAINWQADFERFSYSYYDLLCWQTFFEYLGKKYGLLREYRENGIL